VYVLPPHPSAPPRSWGSKSSLQRCSVKGDAMRGQTDRWTDGRAREEGSAGQGEAWALVLLELCRNSLRA
jgi:hypothetical protein